MTLFFVVAALIAVLGGIGVIAAKHPVHCALGLIANFVGLGLLYFTLHAEFLGVIQLIIYAGAVMVLFLFVIALLTAGREGREHLVETLRGQRVVAGILGAFLTAVLAVAAIPGDTPVASVAPAFGSVADFGKQLLTIHLFAFELTALVLMIAVIGVVILVGRNQSQ